MNSFKLKDGMTVEAPYFSEDYETSVVPGKRYKVTNVRISPYHCIFDLLDNDMLVVTFCLLQGCAYIDYQDWIIVYD